MKNKIKLKQSKVTMNNNIFVFIKYFNKNQLIKIDK